MWSEVVTITPEAAKAWLAFNQHNRPIHRAAVKRYAADMKAGRWELNAQGISFKENGELADGQHRLMAIAEAGVPVTMMVTYGVPDSTFIFDRGRTRSQVNVLQMLGAKSNIANGSVVGAINFLFTLCGNKPSDSTLVKFADDFAEDLATAASYCSRGQKNGIGRQAPIIAAAFCALESGVAPDKLMEFFVCVNSGFTDGKGQSAAIVLRNFILNWKNTGNWLERKAAFGIAGAAISDFVAGRPRTKMYKDAVNPFFADIKARIMPDYIA